MMTDIVDLVDHRKIWKTDAVVCSECGHEWQATYPAGAEDNGLECSACGAMSGKVSSSGNRKISVYHAFTSVLHWEPIETIPFDEFVLICDSQDKIIKYGTAQLSNTGETLIVCGGISVTSAVWWTHWAYITLGEKE
jgi:hypothetical protein